MSDRPVIFSAPMVRALLDGRKTMTRRLAWRQVVTHPDCPEKWLDGVHCADGYTLLPSPWQKVKAGDRLWVRESLKTERYGHPFDDETAGEVRIGYAAGGVEFRYVTAADAKWRVFHARKAPSIHMPRWASRLTLTVTATKIEPLQAISEEDARAEGVLYVPGHGEITPTELRCDPGYSNFLNCRLGFEALWNSLHGDGAWQSNPEVVAVSFSVEQRNIDAAPRCAA